MTSVLRTGSVLSACIATCAISLALLSWPGRNAYADDPVPVEEEVCVEDTSDNAPTTMSFIPVPVCAGTAQCDTGCQNGVPWAANPAICTADPNGLILKNGCDKKDPVTGLVKKCCQPCTCKDIGILVVRCRCRT